MADKYLPEIKEEELKKVQESGDLLAYYDLLCQPLHTELYKRQDFRFMDELTEAQQLLISYDYVQNQVLQGGFIQLIQNGYVALLPTIPQWLMMLGQEEMANVIDEALKDYVLKRDILDKEYTVEEFAKLYKELPEFRFLDERFEELHGQTVKALLDYATHHIEEFATVK